MANATSTQLQELYIAYFARPGDAAGLDYWTNGGISTKAFAENMYLQPEFLDVNGSLSIQEQINNLYLNLFFREADEEGLNYWSRQIVIGNLVLASIANDLIWAAKNNEGSEADLDCLQNRTAAAVAYTEEIRACSSNIIWYKPDSTNPWVSGNLEEGKSYLKAIGCGGVYKYIGYDDILTEYLPSCSPYIAYIDPIIVNTTSNQDSFDECGCNKQLETLSIKDGLFPSLGNSYVDNRLVYDSPYGLSPSNNTVIDLTVSIDDGLF